eukprot:jgi/Mesen1/11029/ME000098S10422
MRHGIRLRGIIDNKSQKSNQGTEWPASQGRPSGPFRNNPQFGFQVMRACKVAAAAVAGVVSIKLCATVVDSIEAVPLLPQVERLIGAVVAGNFGMRFLGGGEGRARIESFIEDIVERFQGNKGDGIEDLEPSMLDVQIRSLIDEHVRVHDALTEEGRVESLPVISSKPALVAALKSFVRGRESKGREVNSMLRKDLAGLKEQQAQLKRAKEAEAEEAAAQMKSLENSTGILQVERDEARSEVIELDHRISDMSVQLGHVSQAREDLERLTRELEGRVLAVTSESSTLKEQLSALEEAKEADAAALRAALAEQATQLKQKEEEVHALQSQLAALEEAKQAEASRLYAALAELTKQQEEKEQEVRALQAQIRELEQARQTDSAFLQAALAQHATQLGQKEEEMRAVQEQLWAMEDTKQADAARLQAALADHATQLWQKEKEMEAVQAQLSAVAEAEKGDSALLKVALAEQAAQLKDKEEEMREVQEQLWAMEEAKQADAALLQAALADHASQLWQKEKEVSAVQDQLAATEEAKQAAVARLEAALAEHNAQLKQKEAEMHVVVKDLLQLEESKQADVAKLKAVLGEHAAQLKQKEEEVSAAQEQLAASDRARQEEAARAKVAEAEVAKRLQVKEEEMQNMQDQLKRALAKERVLQQYARAVAPNFVDYSKPVKDQLSQISEFAEHLVTRSQGLSYDEAQAYIRRRMANIRTRSKTGSDNMSADEVLSDTTADRLEMLGHDSEE